MIRKFFGDGERDFALPANMILELERVTGNGIGELFRKATGNAYRFAEITETIRLAMIGGGTSPGDASALVTGYVATAGHPFATAHLLALDILTDFYAGAKSTEAPNE